MENKEYKEIIDNYIKAYNAFDIEMMIKDMDENVRFENISNGETNLVTEGIDELKAQAETAKEYLKEREIRIIDIKYKENIVDVDIEYSGILAVDLEGGLNAGDKIELIGNTIFYFKDNKIIKFQDIT